MEKRDTKPGEFTDEQHAIMTHAIRSWGTHQQVIKAVEEMAELQKNLCKWLNLGVKIRGGSLDAGELNEAIREEMADVHIMLYQLRCIFGDRYLNIYVEDKLRRLKGYMPPMEGSKDA